MTHTPRERLLVLVIPAALVFVAYVYAWNVRVQREIVAKQDQVDKALVKAVSPAEVAQKQAELRKRQDEVRELERRRDETKAQLDALASGLGQVRVRNEAIGEVSILLQSHRLLIEEASALASSPADAAVPASLRAAMDRLKSSAGYRPPQLYKIKFLGRYRDVAQALRRVSDEGLAVPVQLQMDESYPNVDWRVWTLHVWI